MNLEIIPKKSVGPIHFGNTRKEVRQALDSSVDEFMKTKEASAPTDAFDELGIHVFYDQKDCCEAVELFEESNAIFNNVSLFSMTVKEALTWLNQLDGELELDEVSAISQRLGLSLYAAEGLENNEDHLDSVLVFREGYYD